jgi:uncharacterized protein (DUF736 family)
MAEQKYDNTNTFTLFKNEQGDNPKKPNYTGLANVDGIEFRIAGWIRQSQNGTKFISGTIQLKDGDVKPKAVEVDEDVPF